MPLRKRIRKFVALYLMNLGLIIGKGIEQYEADKKREREERDNNLREQARVTQETQRVAKRLGILKYAITRDLAGFVDPVNVPEIFEQVWPQCLLYEFGTEFVVCGPEGADLEAYLRWYITVHCPYYLLRPPGYYPNGDGTLYRVPPK